MQIVANNKKAFFEYFILEKIEAGIQLTGDEVKSLRSGKASIKEAYAEAKKGQLYLVNSDISNYEKASNDFVAGLNPNVRGTYTSNRKIVRGGSWKDVAHFLKVSTRDFEYQNRKKSYIGFRTVQSYLGEDVGFQENPNKIF